jgi:energy-coupling factor transporter ATP-binding protein EcfA2
MPGQFLNDPHPWTEGVHAELSLVDLVANGTIPARPAGLLWWAVERGASLVTAGGPSGAGKTTLANALLAFLPAGAGIYAVAGADDPLQLPDHDGRTYLLVCELSDHPRPFYIAGEPARRVFSLVGDGVGLVGTLHADSVAEALDVLAGEVGLAPAHISRVDLIAVSRVENEAEFLRPGRFRGIAKDAVVDRRIIEIGLVAAGPDGRPGQVALASMDEASGKLRVADAPAGIAALAGRLGVPPAQAEAEIAARADALAGLAARGRRDPADVEEAVGRLRGA